MGEPRRRLAILYGSQTGNAQVIDGSVAEHRGSERAHTATVSVLLKPYRHSVGSPAGCCRASGQGGTAAAVQPSSYAHGLLSHPTAAGGALCCLGHRNYGTGKHQRPPQKQLSLAAACVPQQSTPQLKVSYLRGPAPAGRPSRQHEALLEAAFAQESATIHPVWHAIRCIWSG